MALMDDTSTAYKVKGCAALDTFLSIVPAPLLQRTGLGEVLHTALMPNLLYLPTLTPEEESLHLLGATYPTLIRLARVQYSDDSQRSAKGKVMDSIFRKGILQGYAHAGENVKIAELLINMMRSLINEMGVESVKHLKV